MESIKRNVIFHCYGLYLCENIIYTMPINIQRRNFMKKLVIIIIVLLIALSFTADTKAMEYMAGAKTGYYAWQPFLKDAGGSGMSDIEWGTGMLYGPIVSLIFSPDISFSVAGLIGKQSTHWQSMYSDFDGNKQITGTYYFEAFRADFDSALSLKLVKILRYSQVINTSILI